MPLLHHAAWHLLKKSLKVGQQLGLVPDALKIDIKKNAYGKPYLAYHPDIYFNLSHTLGYVACAISRTEVGIDVEKVRPYRKVAASKVCTPLEQALITQSKDPNEMFFRLWTLKESIVKAEGTGINQSLKQFEFYLDSKEILRLKQTNLKYHFNQIIIEGQYILSVCKK